MPRRIDADHFARAHGRGAQAPAAQIAADVQHALARHITRHAVAVGVLVVEPAGLLSADHVAFELDATFVHDDRRVERAVADVGILGQLFHAAAAGVVLPHQRTRLEHLDHGFGDLVLEAFHAGRRGLADDDVAEAVKRQARQAVRLAVDEAVVRFVEQALAQAQRDIEPVHDQRTVERVFQPARNEARADQRIRIDVADTDRLGRMVDDDAEVTRREAGQRRALDVDLVGEHPQMSGAQARILAFLEEQRGVFDGVGHGKPLKNIRRK